MPDLRWRKNLRDAGWSAQYVRLQSSSPRGSLEGWPLAGALRPSRARRSLWTDALARMGAHGVRRLPVVDAQGALVGIVAFDDLLEQVSVAMAELSKLLRRERSVESSHRH